MKILATSNHGNTFNPKEGADARKYNLLMELEKYNDVYILESNRYQNDKSRVPSNIKVEYFREINILGYPLSFLLDFNPSYISKLIHLIKNGNFDIIQISFCYGIIIAKLIIFFLNKKTKIIYDAHNVEAESIFPVSGKNHSLFINYFFRIYIPLIEKLAINATDHVICVSGNDKLSFIKKYNLNPNNITVIPSGSKVRVITTTEKRHSSRCNFGIDMSKKVILFHGTYSYTPNKEAIDLIINYIAPEIKKKFDDVLFLLAGNGVPVFENSNVKSIGFVDSLDSLLYLADVAIVPILKGGGTRLKILDYMSVGLPIISTKKGIEGIKVINGEEAIICDDVDGRFIDSIVDILNDDLKRENLSVNVHNLFNEKYDWGSIGLKLFSLYNNISINTST